MPGPQKVALHHVEPDDEMFGKEEVPATTDLPGGLQVRGCTSGPPATNGRGLEKGKSWHASYQFY